MALEITVRIDLATKKGSVTVNLKLSEARTYDDNESVDSFAERVVEAIRQHASFLE